MQNRWTHALVVLLTIIAGTAVGWLVLYFARLFWHPLRILLFAAVFSFILMPVVDWLQRWVRLRGLAVILTIIAVFLLLSAAGFYLSEPLISELQVLMRAIPGYVDQLEEWLPWLQQMAEQYGFSLDMQPQNLGQLARNVAGLVQTGTVGLIGFVISAVGGVSTFVADVVLILVFTIYMLLDARRLREHAYALVPEHWLDWTLLIEDTAGKVFGGYLRGQLFVALILGLSVGVGVSLIGLQYGVLLGIIAGIFELIPVIGAIIGAIPAVIVALLQGGLQLGFWTVIFFIVIQQLEGNLLVPKISGQAVGLHPLATIVTVIGGIELGGILLGLVAVPIVGFLYELFLAWWEYAGYGEAAAARRRRTRQ